MPLLIGFIPVMRYSWPSDPTFSLSLLTFVNGAVFMLFIGIAAPRLFGWVRIAPAQGG